MGYDTPWWMVILLGMGIVFMGLGLLVLLCNIIRLLFAKGKEPTPIPVQEEEIPNRKRLLAAVAAAVAEAEGTDISGFRIVSFNRRRQA